MIPFTKNEVTMQNYLDNTKKKRIKENYSLGIKVDLI